MTTATLATAVSVGFMNSKPTEAGSGEVSLAVAGCVKSSDQPKGDSAPVLCSLNSNRLIVESSSRQTVVTRADAVSFNRVFDLGSKAQNQGIAPDLMERDRALLILSGVPAETISTTSSTIPPVLTVTINDPTDASVKAFLRTIGILQKNSGFVNPITGFGIRYLRDCNALDARASREAYLTAKQTASHLSAVIGSRLTRLILHVPLVSYDDIRADVSCGSGHLVGLALPGSEFGDIDVASTRTVDAFFDAAPARQSEVKADELGVNGISWVTSLAAPPENAVARAHYVASSSSQQVFATGTSLRENSVLQEVAMPTFALKQAIWRAQIAASALGFRTVTVDGLIAYAGDETFADPPLTFETGPTQSVGVFLGLLADPTHSPAMPTPTAYANSVYEAGRNIAHQPIDKSLPFVTGSLDVANATISVRAPSRTALILFHFHRDGKAFTDGERSSLSQAIYFDSGEDFVRDTSPSQPFDLTAGGWIQFPTNERIARLVAASRRFASQAGAESTALYHATAYSCLPLEEQAISAAALSAYAQAVSVSGGAANALYRIRSIGVLGPFVRQGDCGHGALNFPPDSDPRRFTQRLDNVGDPTVIMEASVSITVDTLRPNR